jgi:endoglucanase
VSNPLKIGAVLETWTGISGYNIEELVSSTNNFTVAPSKTEVLNSILEAPSNVDDNYGSHMKGWLVPPVTGNYEFWITSDDEGEFWLSVNDDPANVVKTCFSPWASGPGWWDRVPDQKSSPIYLVAGQAVYYEVR